MTAASILRRFYLEAKLQFAPASLVPLAAFAAVALGVWFWGTNPGHTRRTRDVLLVLEVALPAASAVITAHALAADRDASFEPLLMSYPCGMPSWAFWRVLPVVVTLAAAFAAVASAAGAWYMDLDKARLAQFCGPTLVVLSGLAALGSLFAAPSQAAAVVPLAYWALDLMTRGSCTRRLYLFEGAYPSAFARPGDKLWLSLAGAVMWALAAVLKRRAYRRR